MLYLGWHQNRVLQGSEFLRLTGTVIHLLITGGHFSCSPALGKGLRTIFLNKKTLAISLSRFGALLTRFGYSVPAFLLALLLGPLAERNLAWSLQIGGMTSFMRPIAVVIFIATIGVLVLPVLLKKMEKKGKDKADKTD